MGAGHGIGVKRNDYHRRNRRRNISMHKHSHGAQYPAIGIRVIKRETLESLLLRERNAKEHAAFHGREGLPSEEPISDAEYSAALTSLKFQAVIYSPPFLSREEIRARRFSDAHGEMNDRWWEWEREKKAREEQFRWR
jgi:hypothetical protein